MGFNEFDAQLREDVHHIQIVAAQSGDTTAQIGRVEHIAMAASFCLQRLMGPLAAAHWLHELAAKIEAQAGGHVH